MQNINITDAEIIALQDAIRLYKDFIQKKIGNRVEAPYWARLQSIQKLENKIL